MKSVLLFLLTAASLLAAPATPSTDRWDVATTGTVSVGVPKGWRKMDGIRPDMLIFRQGDGIGVPIVDETKAPLQIGLTVEKFAPSEDSTEAIARKTAKTALSDPRMTIAEDETIEAITLSDHTGATFLTKPLFKSTHRRSLQMKLFAKDYAGNTWVISGYIVGARDSQLPTPKSPLAIWLRAHLESATFSGKGIDPKSLEATYRNP